MSKFIDLTGQKFDRLRVIEEAGRNKHKQVLWLCRCTCGNKIIVAGHHLKNDHTKSCGCLRKEKLSEIAKKATGKNSNNYKHGLWGTKEYDCARSSKRRAMKLNQTPLDANLGLIQFYYIVSSTMADYEVDHIQPISKGGLHHEDNLQILNAHLNKQKSDKWPLTEEEQIRYKGFRL